MSVDWVDDVAYRRGFGAVHIDAWAQAEPQKTTVTLGERQVSHSSFEFLAKDDDSLYQHPCLPINRLRTYRAAN